MAWDSIQRCPGCGLDIVESTDPDNRGNWVGEIVRCHGCTAKGVEQQAASQEKKPPGYFVTIRRKEDPLG